MTQPDQNRVNWKAVADHLRAVGDDSFYHPGSSFLWIGTDHHLNREQVQELVEHMQHWLDHKRLPLT